MRKSLLSSVDCFHSRIHRDWLHLQTNTTFPFISSLSYFRFRFTRVSSSGRHINWIVEESRRGLGILCRQTLIRLDDKCIEITTKWAALLWAESKLWRRDFKGNSLVCQSRIGSMTDNLILSSDQGASVLPRCCAYSIHLPINRLSRSQTVV